ncbi:MAG TPA: CotH kinase family protein, partial [Bacillota bacterium]|nr:CotH kinase family protein [Bacillota bacterium]
MSFTFPSNTVLAADGYLVVARNAARLRTNYANLNLTNCLGDFSGKLSHQGEHLALTMPDSITSTNQQGVVATNWIHIQVCDATYGSGGRWGQWAAGGGSSLELIDPGANPRLAANWADSDETQKSSWANIETTAVLDNGVNYETAIQHAQIGLLDVGECLVDNVEVRSGTAGVNLVANPGFETGTNNWSFQGDHCRSSLETSGYSSSRSLHIRATDGLWTGANSCQMDLNANSLAQGQTATLRFKARWLRGWPEVLLRLNGNWLEATGRLPVPGNLGTPGARNSRFVGNAGPAIYQVTHTPPVPAAGQPVVVTARAHDPNGLANLMLYYRIDPASAYTAVAMKDDGTGGDAIAGDGLYSATLPGQAANSVVAFYLWAQDSKAATTRFPAALTTQAPTPECVVLFGDGNPGGSFGVYHLWITQTNATRWNQLSDLSNEAHDCTFVHGTRVIYNVQARFAGSPYHQGFDWPYGNLCHYKWIFPDDDKFLGATSFNKIHQPGNGAGDDASLQREQVANMFLRALGVPWLYRHYVVVYVNGNRRGSLMEDAQTPGGDIIDEYFPNDKDGWLYKMQPWFEFGPEPQGISIPFNNNSWCNLMPYTTTGGGKKVARYRYNFLARTMPNSLSDYTNVFSLIDAASSYGSANYVANMENLADMENWMRVFAANHAAGNWDSFGAQNAQNLYGYMGSQGTKYSLLMFDFNISIGNSGSWGPGQNLFAVNGQDPNTANLYNEPTFRRMYWRALQELINGPLDVTRSGPLLDAKYKAFVANGMSVENPNASIKGWLTAARSSIAAQLAAENAAGFTVNSTVSVNNGVATVTGTAPVGIKTIWINGAEYPLTWTSLTGWKVAVPLKPGSNPLSVVGVDLHAQPVAGASNLVA